MQILSEYRIAGHLRQMSQLVREGRYLEARQVSAEVVRMRLSLRLQQCWQDIVEQMPRSERPCSDPYNYFILEELEFLMPDISVRNCTWPSYLHLVCMCLAYDGLQSTHNFIRHLLELAVRKLGEDARSAGIDNEQACKIGMCTGLYMVIHALTLVGSACRKRISVRAEDMQSLMVFARSASSHEGCNSADCDSVRYCPMGRSVLDEFIQEFSK